MVTEDFFRAPLDQMIDLRHPLAVLGTRMPWTDIDASLALAFLRTMIARAGLRKARTCSARPWQLPA